MWRKILAGTLTGAVCLLGLTATATAAASTPVHKKADHPNVLSMHHDRSTGGKMNRAAVVEGARAVQEQLGYDGAGVTVAVLDSGITPWHDDLGYRGTNPKVKVVGGQRTVKFVDFVN